MLRARVFFCVLFAGVFLLCGLFACNENDNSGEGESEGEGEGDFDNAADGDADGLTDGDADADNIDADKENEADAEVEAEKEADDETETEKEAEAESDTSCEGQCSYGIDHKYCDRKNENTLCQCSPSGQWQKINCNFTCIGDGFSGSKECRISTDSMEGDCICESDDDVEYCLGPCDSNHDRDKCINNGQDACLCNAGQWTLYECGNVCAESGVSAGCGETAWGTDYCLCEITVPTDCEGSCIEGQSPGFCDTQNEGVLCLCNESSQYEYWDCENICRLHGYYYNNGCIETETNEYGCECTTVGPECIIDQDCIDEGLGNKCLDGMCKNDCALARCDCSAGEDACWCSDIGLESDNGICIDLTQIDTNCTVGESCGGSKNKICVMNYESSEKYCMDLCTPLENTCPDGQTCYPLTNQDGEIVGSGCIE